MPPGRIRTARGGPNRAAIGAQMSRETAWDRAATGPEESRETAPEHGPYRAATGAERDREEGREAGPNCPRDGPEEPIDGLEQSQ